MQQTSSVMCFGGQQRQFTHKAHTVNCEMTFSVYLPPQAQTQKVPVLYWLSGLTCTDQNFVTKAGAQNAAAKHGIAIVCPDTSPRGDNVPDDADEAWDMGLGAGFYVNASQSPWSEHYHMYDYVVDELPALVAQEFPIDTTRVAISGHSMGGHGALVVALNNPKRYRSVSAFSPIVAPSHCPWGQKAFTLYLGEDRNSWAHYDACILTEKATHMLPVLIDQGSADTFLEEQLKTERLVGAAQQADYPMQIRYQAGYDHSYFFIASFIGEHIAFHAEHLLS